MCHRPWQIRPRVQGCPAGPPRRPSSALPLTSSFPLGAFPEDRLGRTPFLPLPSACSQPLCPPREAPEGSFCLPPGRGLCCGSSGAEGEEGQGVPRAGKGGWARKPWVSQQTGAVGQGVQLGRAGPGYPGSSVLATEVWGELQVPEEGCVSVCAGKAGGTWDLTEGCLRVHASSPAWGALSGRSRKAGRP